MNQILGSNRRTLYQSPIYIYIPFLNKLSHRYEQYRRVFDRFDSNGDGRICPVELLQCVASMGGKMTAEEAQAAVALMDSDGDGLLCLEDFVKIVEGAGEDEKASDLKEVFHMYVEAESGSSSTGSSSSSGYCITPKSLRRMLSRLGERRSVDDCKNMIASFDLNKDGVLSFEEFKVMMSR